MKKSKIFFFDLDGTLLTSEKKISPATRTALDNFTAAGNRFVICTGRALDSAITVQKELDLFYPGTYLVGYNGAQIYDCEQHRLLYRVAIPMELVSKIFSIAKEHGIHCQTYTDDSIITPDEGEELSFYRRVIKTPYTIADDVTAALDKAPSKCLCIELYDHKRLERLRSDIEAVAGDRLTIMYTNPYYLEMIPSEAGKGSAVTRLCSILGIPVSDSIAAGDEENDVSMIKAAGTGIAMLNGSASAKAAADVITAMDNDHDGLVPFMQT